jgi:hypothetical protein
MISIFFRVGLSGKREVCVRFGIADPELPLILNRTGKDSQTSLRLSKMLQSSRFGRNYAAGEPPLSPTSHRSLNGSGGIVGNSSPEAITEGLPVTRAEPRNQK